MRHSLVTAAVLTLGLSGVAAAAELESGLQVGERAGAFNVKDCTGPSAGKSLCYR